MAGCSCGGTCPCHSGGSCSGSCHRYGGGPTRRQQAETIAAVLADKPTLQTWVAAYLDGATGQQFDDLIAQFNGDDAARWLLQAADNLIAAVALLTETTGTGDDQALIAAATALRLANRGRAADMLTAAHTLGTPPRLALVRGTQ